MPRKPTAHARHARQELITLARAQAGRLPPLAVLAERFDIHASTVFRILRDLVAEGVYWQSPTGKFLPVSAQREALRDAPLCFIGREMHHWSRLYQELLEGVSEVCSANEGNLILISSPNLLSQASPDEVRSILPKGRQAVELGRLLKRLPSGAAGVLLDHLWDEEAFSKAAPGRLERRSFLHPLDSKFGCAVPNYEQGANLALAHVQRCGYAQSIILRPFPNDPAIDATVHAIQDAAKAHPVQIAEGQDRAAIRSLLRRNRSTRHRTCILCPEDNTATSVARAIVQEGITPHEVGLISLQGTGAVGLPLTHIRYDYRRLGRAAAAAILHGRKPWVAPATFVAGRTTEAAQ